MRQQFLIACTTLTISLGLLASCNRQSNTGNADDTKLQLYYVQGELLYLANCSNCHQKDGSGLRLVYPPLYPSDFIDNNPEQVLCLIRNGSPGGLTVNGNRYVQRMPPHSDLTDLEIAEIATYLYNTWGRKEGIVEVTTVSAALEKCSN